MSFLEHIQEAYSALHGMLYAQLVEPVLFAMGKMAWAEDAFDGTEWFLLGCIQLLIISVIFRTWERFWPAEQQAKTDPNIRTDLLYTLIHRLGFFHGIFFILFAGIFFQISSLLHDIRFERLNVENWLPGFTSIPIISFFIYLILLDFIDYLYHRASHRIHWWWQLHALHHSQTTMTAWSDDRNHMLDDVMRAMVFAFFALLFGVPPGQFIFLVVLSQLIQSWQHANINVHLGWARYLIVSPLFHRYHHAVGYGHDAPGKPGVLGGCNFGVLFPWWDIAFGTAVFTDKVYPTGVRNLKVSNNLLVQQWQGLRHSVRELFSSRGQIHRSHEMH
jgi:sterol desaturase/sphingolipid hydroxylase (fatty acid hydroxylase superfamily)